MRFRNKALFLMEICKYVLQQTVKTQIKTKQCAQDTYRFDTTVIYRSINSEYIIISIAV